MWGLQRWPAALMVLAISAMLATEAAGACAGLTSCGACRNTTFCHWCPDQQCHAIGSIHGCLYGTYCYDNDQCQRKLPEYRGYAAPSVAVLMGVFLVGGTALVCGVAVISTAREYARESTALRESAASARPTRRVPPQSSARVATRRDEEYMMLVGDEGGVLTGGASVEEGVTEGIKRAPQVAGRSDRSRRVRRARPDLSVMEPPGPSPLARKIVWYTQFICGIGMMATLFMCSLVVMFAPHAPGVNICNTKFDWGSIVHSLETISVEADFQILVSVYNPNVMDVKIENGVAVLNHKHTEIGTMAFEPAVLEGGYVTDLLLTITFDGKTWEDAKLGIEYKTGQLAFLMDATVSASVMWHGLKTYTFTFSVDNYYIKVAKTTAYDRSLCNCAHMLQALPEDEHGKAMGVIAGGVLMPTTAIVNA